MKGQRESEEGSPVELQGWKEIAHHLGVSVRRAQQWETELQLPINRLQLGRRARILASTSQLDEWRRTRSSESLALPDPDAVGEFAGTAARRKPLVVALLVSSLVVVAGVVTYLLGRSPDLAGVAIRDGQLEARDSRGAVLWRRSFPEGQARLPEAPYSVCSSGTCVANTSFVEDVDGDGSSEAVFVLSRTLPMQQLQREIVFCLDSKGNERWRFAAGRVVTWQGRTFDDGYLVHWVAGPFDYQGRRALTVGAQNVYFPFQIVVLDAATGAVLGEFWHPGGLAALALLDLDRDGSLEILAGGVNNPGPGAGLPALLRLHQPLPPPMAADDDVFERSARVAVDYVLFPSVSAFEDEEFPRRVSWIRKGNWDTLELGVSLGPLYGERGQIYYTLSEHLDPLEAKPCDLLRSYYRRLVEQGTLGHALSDGEISTWKSVRHFSHVPDANSPTVRRLWTASN